MTGMEVQAEITVQVPADQAWALVGTQFGQVAAWASPITASSLDGPPQSGAVRVCHIRGFGPVPPGVIRERLLSYDPAARSLSYQADGLPWYITCAVSRWQVRPADGGASAVSIRATMTLQPLLRPFSPAVRWRMRRDSAAVLDELAHRLRTGLPHPRKVAAASNGSSTVL